MKRLGSMLMVCWNGEGAAKIFKHDENALLMERATGKLSLKQMVISGNEDTANQIICDVAAKLHSVNCGNIEVLVPLPVWFAALEPAADKFDGVLADCNAVANRLLKLNNETVVLHGDIHYDNILDSGTRGWIAIDPKGLKGERAFDFANIFCNPNIEIAASPFRLSKQVKFISKAADLNRKRLLEWVVAWAGLSAAWIINDGEDAALPLAVAKIALNELST